MTPARMSRRITQGFSLVEVLVAAVIIAIVSLAAVAFYSNSRVGEIREWQEQNALFLAEKEVELWQASGYTGLAGFVAADVGPSNFLPYGYRYGSADPLWNVGSRYKAVNGLSGTDYRIRARLLYSESTGSPANDFFVREVFTRPGGDVNYYYRRVEVVVQWGGFSGTSSDEKTIQETRMAR